MMEKSGKPTAKKQWPVIRAAVDDDDDGSNCVPHYCVVWCCAQSHIRGHRCIAASPGGPGAATHPAQTVPCNVCIAVLQLAALASSCFDVELLQPRCCDLCTMRHHKLDSAKPLGFVTACICPAARERRATSVIALCACGCRRARGQMIAFR